MTESTAIFSVEVADQVSNEMNEFVYLGRNVNCNADLSIEVNRRIRNALCSFRRYILELYDRPNVPPALNIRMLRAEVLDNVVRLRHVVPARVPLRHGAPSPPQLPGSLHRVGERTIAPTTRFRI